MGENKLLVVTGQLGAITIGAALWKLRFNKREVPVGRVGRKVLVTAFLLVGEVRNSRQSRKVFRFGSELLSAISV